VDLADLVRASSGTDGKKVGRNVRWTGRNVKAHLQWVLAVQPDFVRLRSPGSALKEELAGNRFVSHYALAARYFHTARATRRKFSPTTLRTSPLDQPRSTSTAASCANTPGEASFMGQGGAYSAGGQKSG
jgi:hypothetical protein